MAWDNGVILEKAASSGKKFKVMLWKSMETQNVDQICKGMALNGGDKHGNGIAVRRFGKQWNSAVRYGKERDWHSRATQRQASE